MSVPEACIHQLFEDRVVASTSAIAAICDGKQLTYGQLNRRANRLARLLRSRGVGSGTPIAIWMERGLDLLVSMLAALKAGGHYVPLEPDWPVARAQQIAIKLGIRHLVTHSSRLRAVLELQSGAPRLTEIVALDVRTAAPAPEPVDRAVVESLWDMVARRSCDDIGAAGFISSYTGEPFTGGEVDAYRHRVVELARRHLPAGARVLEIGSGSGLVLSALAPEVARYVGLDPSAETQRATRERLERERIAAELVTGFADEIDERVGGRFELVILASAAQFFPGPRYLEVVLEKALARLEPGGAILVADVMDAARKQEFRDSLERHRSAHPGAATRTNLDQELYLDAQFFRDWAARHAVAIQVLPRDTGFDSELRFRFDVLIEKRAGAVARSPRRHLHTGWHLADLDDSNLPPVQSPDELAYVIHTSGSTGQPKGVMVEHRPVVNVIDWVNRTFAVGPDDRLLFVTSPCFDLSVYDVFGMLAAGGSVHVASEGELRDPARLARLIESREITFWDSAPAALEQVVPFLRDGAASGLRLVFLSGDWIPLRLPDEMRSRFPRAEVVSLGGATEAAIWSNVHRVGELDPAWPSIPYGLPIQNATYHALDDRLAPAAGVPAHLFIGGEVLARGYARDPATTAERFVPDPFSDVPGARLYRTGDLVRRHPDEVLEFLGRADHQVKVRGFRIELGEIESVLGRHPAVRQAVAVARDDGTGRRLVGYVVPAEGRPGPDELRDYLRQRLPEYMVPPVFVVLDRLPMTASGKIDRAALPAPVAERRTFVAPESDLERTIARVWSEVLRIDPIGVDDGFLDLGGNSLIAARIASRLGVELGREVSVAAILQQRTIASLAVAVAGPGARPASVPRRRPDARVPLTLEQERVWFLEQLHPGAIAYAAQVGIRLRGELRRDRLEQAFSAVVRRHEILRTTFRADESGVPCQEIHPPFAVEIPLVDLDSEAELHRHVQAEIRRPFDVSRLPLFRCLLYRLAPDDHLLVEIEHHFVHDGWSVANLLTELQAHYAALVEGRELVLPELPFQYADHAIWQRDELDRQRDLDHWVSRMSGHDFALDLPADRPRPPALSLRGDCRQVELPGELCRALRELSRAEGSTLFMTLASAFSALLARSSGQTRFVLGSSDANRRVPGSDGQLGMFVNTFPIPVDASGDPSFRELVARFRATALDLSERPDVAIDALVTRLGAGGDISRNPLFQVDFSFHDSHIPAIAMPGLTGEVVYLHNGSAKFDLNLVVVPWAEQRRQTAQGAPAREEILVLWEYNTDLYDAATVDRMIAAYQRLLEAVVARPDQRLSELPLLSDGEASRIVHEGNRSELDLAGERCLHELFAEQVRRAPDAAALEFRGQLMSYRELARRACTMAAGLAARGIGPESLVGVAYPSSPELVVSLLGILEAGAAYVYLDPQLPPRRLADMSAGVALVVGPAEVAGRFPPGTFAALEEIAGADRPRAAGPDNLAYVIYTSGSTGAPKGAMISHRAIANQVRAQQAQNPIGGDDAVLQVASFSFDQSVLEIFWPLTSGARLVLREPGPVGAAELAALVRERGVTAHIVIPSLMRFLLEEPDYLAAPRLRLLLIGGEPLTAAMAGQIHRVFPRLELVNIYGPTEAAVVATRWRSQADAAAISVGRPLPNTTAFVLDSALRPVPPGVAGELYLGGMQVARGYLDRPGLTAERFLPCPFATWPGQRIYRTGDRARLLPGGDIELLGRDDGQVKLRGYRVELGEIEAALSSRPGVREAVVLVRSLGAESQLVAYLVVDGEWRPDALQAELAGRLPAYMVPSLLVRVDRMPRLASGKVDRGALPAPEPSVSNEAGDGEPADAIEEVLLGIWADVLDSDRIRMSDDFFALGGHSLLAMRVISRIRNLLAVEVPLREFFRAPRLDALARVVTASSPDAGRLQRRAELLLEHAEDA